MTGPYTFTRSEGLVHIHAPANPQQCVACVRIDAFEIVWHEARQEAIQQMRAAVERSSSPQAGGQR